MFLNIYNLAAIHYDKKQRLSILTFENGEILTSRRKPVALLNHLCLSHGSTLQGRVASAQFVLGIRQKAPVMVCLTMNCSFFPTQSLRSEGCVWVQARLVRNTISISSTQTRIVIADNNWVDVDIGIRSVKKQLERCENYYTRITMPLDKGKLSKII